MSFASMSPVKRDPPELVRRPTMLNGALPGGVVVGWITILVRRRPMPRGSDREHEMERLRSVRTRRVLTVASYHYMRLLSPVLV